MSIFCRISDTGFGTTLARGYGVLCLYCRNIVLSLGKILPLNKGNYKQLYCILDEVFVISRIVKVEVG
jgi:hypothetical protein